MLQSKDINKIWELKTGFTQRWLEPEFILSSLKSFSFSDLCHCISPVKVRGYSFQVIFTMLVSLPFIGAASVNSMVNRFVTHQVEAGKDTFYRLKNNPDICWRLILWLFAAKFKKLTETNSDNTNSVKCMVFDDTVIAKRGLLKKYREYGIMFQIATCWVLSYLGTEFLSFRWIFRCIVKRVKTKKSHLA